jgi:nucleotide-binding universal stress UspA family protein
VLKEIVDLADRYGRPIRTALRLAIAPEDAILRQARVGQYNLIVMGVGGPQARLSSSARWQLPFSKIRIVRSCL